MDPLRVKYLAKAAGRLVPVVEADILQVGEAIASVRTTFKLLDFIPAQRDLMIGQSVPRAGREATAGAGRVAGRCRTG